MSTASSQALKTSPIQVLGPYAKRGHAGYAACWHAVGSVLAIRHLAGPGRPRPSGSADRNMGAQIAAASTTAHIF